MERLIWAPGALRDVQFLHRLLAEKSPVAACRAVGEIRAALQVVARQPGVGRPVADMAPEYRDWPIDFGVSGYVARYRWYGETAVVLAARSQREAGHGDGYCDD